MSYLDYAATTPLLEEVLEAMMPYFRDDWGNPSSVYSVGRRAKKGLEEARELVAGAIGSQPGEIIFTGGGTEADNLAIKGTAYMAKRGKKSCRVITAASEHHAVLHSVDWLSKQGFDVEVVGVDRDGRVDLEALESSLSSDTVLVSVMLANNEVGTVQPIREVVDMVKNNSRALVHADAVQGLGKVPVDVLDLGVDLASFAAHKIGGPKGVGALFVRRGTPIEAVLHGGGQERDLRSGTPNVAGIAGMGVASRIAAEEVAQEGKRLSVLRAKLEAELPKRIEGVHINGAGTARVPGTSNVCIEGVEGESLLLMLDSEEVAASSGSACTSGSLEPSHVLTAMGIPSELAIGSLRVSMGRGSTDNDVDHLLDVLPPIVDKLRSIRRSGENRPARPAVPKMRGITPQAGA